MARIEGDDRPEWLYGSAEDDELFGRGGADQLRGGGGDDQLHGGTFTVSNLGSLGIESFTPLLNPPQVALLGLGAMQLKPIEGEGEVAFVPHISLSLTINHQVVDGAPAARFLQDLAQRLARIGEAITPAQLSGANETP